MSSIRKEIRKFLLAGLGAAAEGVERSDALLEKLAEKGEDTLKQSKIKNEELKRTIRESIRGEKESKALQDAIEKMDAGQLQALKARIEKLEQQAVQTLQEAETVMKAAEDAGSDAVDAVKAAAEDAEAVDADAGDVPAEDKKADGAEA